MAAPHAKRKVMGRIDISNSNIDPPSSSTPHSRSSTPTARVSASSPIHLTNGSVRKARVNPSAVVSPGVTAHLSSIGRGTLASTNAIAGSPTVRAPLHGSSMYNAAKSPGLSGEQSQANQQSSFFPTVRASVASTSSRQGARSPSPSRIHTQLRPGPGPESRPISPNGASQRLKTRPASVIFGHHEGARVTNGTAAQRSGTPLTAKVSSSGHVRAQSSVPLELNRPAYVRVSSAEHERSRSPSPTFTKAYARDGRRISHSSTASIGGTSSVSSTHQLDTTQRPSFTSINAGSATKRPSLSSLHALGSTRGVSEHSNQSGLESPLDIPSPISHPASGGSITSPPEQLSFYSPTTALTHAVVSPSVEYDAEALEAKTNRKILDLEITNKSLLAINSGLEVVKLQQAREIRELKRRNRDGRGLGDRLELDEAESAGHDVSGDYSGSVTDDEDESDEETPLNAELEEAHMRCKALIDAMVEQARHAILSKYESEQRSVGNRVLHPTEVNVILESNTDPANEEEEPIDEAVANIDLGGDDA